MRATLKKTSLLLLLMADKDALTMLQKARTLAGSGHHLSDIYCEMPDEVFLQDIDIAIETLKLL